MKKQIFFLLLVGFMVFYPFQVFAEEPPLPFMPSKDEMKMTSKTTDDLIESVLVDIGSLSASVYSWSIIIITLFFLAGTLCTVFALLLKNGQWQKYGQNTMFFSFIVVLLLRGLPILFLSTQSAADISILLDNSVNVLSSTTVYIALISIGASFLFKFAYHLIEHPEFYRWHRNLLATSMLMILLAVTIPVLFPTI